VYVNGRVVGNELPESGSIGVELVGRGTGRLADPHAVEAVGDPKVCVLRNEVCGRCLYDGMKDTDAILSVEIRLRCGWGNAEGKGIGSRRLSGRHPLGKNRLSEGGRGRWKGGQAKSSCCRVPDRALALQGRRGKVRRRTVAAKDSVHVKRGTHSKGHYAQWQVCDWYIGFESVN